MRPLISTGPSVGVGKTGVSVDTATSVGAAALVGATASASGTAVGATVRVGSAAGRGVLARTGAGSITASGVICGGASSPNSTLASVRAVGLLSASAPSSATMASKMNPNILME